MIKKLAAVLALLLMLGNCAYAKPVKTVNAPTYLLANADDGAILVQENCTTEVKPGDFSKIMTAILACEKFQMTDLLTFKNELAFNNNFGNIASVKNGYRLTVLQHLQNMLLLYSDASANELAIAHSGSVEKFTEQMNKKAKEFGMTDTVFSSPSGYDPDSLSTTTAKDLVILARKACDNDTIISITSTDVFYLPPVSSGGSNRMFSSRNHLISRYTYSAYTYKAAQGLMSNVGKDSSSFLGVADKNDRKLIAVVLNSPDNKDMTVYKDVINLFEEGFNNFRSISIASEQEIISEAKIKGSWNGNVLLCVDTAVTAFVPNDYDKGLITNEITKDDGKWAPVKKGDIMGKVKYYYDENFIAEANLIAVKDENFNILAILKNTLFTKLNAYLLLIVLVIVLAVLYLRYTSIIKKEKRKKKRREITGRKN
ncbi:MAG: D-alanyl-D-alanine carboxypeptidase [Clostridia bacterium]|nr:D-alanyl-D-alanine carboxypeptidase [Clostridia bacterium]